MAPKSKRWRKQGSSSKSTASIVEDLSKMNPADTILQHQAKQFICPAIGSGIPDLHSDDDDDDDDDSADDDDDVVDLDDEDDSFFIAIRDPPASRFGATNAEPLFARIVTGVTNIKPITKFGSAIGAMPFTVGRAMKWISAKIVVRWFAEPVRRCCPANSAGEECAKSAPRRVGGAALFCALATPNLQWTAILADFLTVWFVWQVEIKIPV
eukprot:CAMPEP_0168742686 /NCGR_PEP_ID=MMETSP0724-20121128/13164_1 /TAXON_ID=265536 /ORGANISM="Amphiprora sp., Strain CCMP467" /LENGTH=210 /DNA_ID=CAMNT_0008790243 /DNA_START=91 /DNA_END=724 /DNA_ORIENTATION=-